MASAFSLSDYFDPRRVIRYYGSPEAWGENADGSLYVLQSFKAVVAQYSDGSYAPIQAAALPMPSASGSLVTAYVVVLN